MKENLFAETKEIKNKKTLLKNAEKVLKEEFVGIDKIIDNVIINIRPWFLYPELQDKPLVISLFGMTGSGKTSLVKRLLQLLDIERDMIYFNFAEIGEMKSWEVEEMLDTQISSEKSNRVFVYDEFQYAATLDGHGEEKDNKCGLKPFWELLDTGIIHKRGSRYDIQVIKRLMTYALRIDERHSIELKNGVWQNADQCLAGVSEYELEHFRRYFETNSDTSANKQGQVDDDYVFNEYNGSLFIKESYMNRIYEQYERKNPVIDKIEFHNKVAKMDFTELCEFVTEIINEAEKGYSLNFNDSIVFVLANIDEAYQISFNVNPDMLPDQFHKITEKLTIVDIKEALRKRFRNEQIARLGNLFMIYSSFSEDSFRKIIDLQLNKHKQDIYDKWKLDIEFEQSLKDFIYSDSVFPTHGTRPIISAIHEIVKTKLPLVVDNLNENKIKNIDKIVYSYNDGEIVVKSYHKGEEINSFSTKTLSRLNTHRNVRGKNEQTIIATHESGHFIVYTKLFGKLPEKVCSSSVSKDAGGFMLQDVDENEELSNRESLLNQIKVYLGGYVAEGMVFGENKRSIGASQDLKEATTIASLMVRKYGMSDFSFVSTYLTGIEGTAQGLLVRDDNQSYYNNAIKTIIEKCVNEVKLIFNDKDWKAMLKTSAKYLVENVNMPKDKMEEIYDLIPQEKKTVINESYYSDALEKF